MKCRSYLRLAHAGDGRIAFPGDGWSGVGSRLCVHGAEFEDTEGYPATPQARAGVEGRPGRVALDEPGDPLEEGREHEQAVNLPTFQEVDRVVSSERTGSSLCFMETSIVLSAFGPGRLAHPD